MDQSQNISVQNNTLNNTQSGLNQVQQQNTIEQNQNSARFGSNIRQQLFLSQNADQQLIERNILQDDSIINPEQNPVQELQIQQEQQEEVKYNSQQQIQFQSNQNEFQFSSNKNQKRIIKLDAFGPTAPWRLMKKIEYVKKFTKKLMDCSNIIRFKNLRKDHLRAINDQTSFLNKLELVDKEKQHCNILKRYFLSFPIVQPDNFIIIIWDFIILTVSLINFFIVPLLISFPIEIQSQFVLTIQELSLIIYILDIVLRFNIGVYENFTIVKERILIFHQYVQSDFCFDVIIVLVICYFYFFLQNKFILLIHLMKIVLIKAKKKKLEEHFHFEEKWPTTNTLVQLLFMIFTMGHFCACGFMFVAIEQSIESNTWLQKRDLYTAQWYEQYVESMYFSFITMITVGFGDVVPISLLEKVYVILMTIVSCGVFAYTVNIIGSIFQQRAQKKSKLRKQKFEVLNYLTTRNINQTLQLKILKYLDFIHKKEEESNVKGQKIISMIPQNLKEEVLKDYYGRVLMEQRIFNKNFSPDVLEQLTVRMKEIVLGPGEIIYNQGDFDRKLYFIKKGEIEFACYKNKKSHTNSKQQQIYTHQQPGVCWSLGSMKVQHQEQVCMFGLQEFFTGQERKQIAKSLNISHLIYLDFEDFNAVLKESQRDFEQFCMLKDKEIFKDNMMQSYCTLCQKEGHQSHECNYIFYKPSQNLIISKYNFSQVQQRVHYQRKTHKQFKFKSDIYAIKQQLKELRINLIQDQNEKYQEIGSEFLEMLANFGKESDKQFFFYTPEYKQKQDCFLIEIMNKQQLSQDFDEDNDDEYDYEQIDDIKEPSHQTYQDKMSPFISQTSSYLYRNNQNQRDKAKEEENQDEKHNQQNQMIIDLNTSYNEKVRQNQHLTNNEEFKDQIKMVQSSLENISDNQIKLNDQDNQSNQISQSSGLIQSKEDNQKQAQQQFQQEDNLKSDKMQQSGQISSHQSLIENEQDITPKRKDYNKLTITGEQLQSPLKNQKNDQINQNQLSSLNMIAVQLEKLQKQLQELKGNEEVSPLQHLSQKNLQKFNSQQIQEKISSGKKLTYLSTRRKSSLIKPESFESLFPARKGKKKSIIDVEGSQQTQLDQVKKMINDMENNLIHKIRKMVENKDQFTVGSSRYSTNSKMSQQIFYNNEFYIKGFEILKEFNNYNQDYNYTNIIKEMKKKKSKRIPISRQPSPKRYYNHINTQAEKK